MAVEVVERLTDFPFVDHSEQTRKQNESGLIMVFLLPTRRNLLYPTGVGLSRSLKKEIASSLIHSNSSH